MNGKEIALCPESSHFLRDLMILIGGIFDQHIKLTERNAQAHSTGATDLRKNCSYQPFLCLHFAKKDLMRYEVGYRLNARKQFCLQAYIYADLAIWDPNAFKYL